MTGLFQRKADRPDDPADVPSAVAPEDAAASEPAAAADEQATAAMAALPADAAPAPLVAPAPAPAPALAPAEGETAILPGRPGFRERGRMRRRLRYLRRLRELQVRDLGGLVFELRRFGRDREDLIAQKIDQLRACDDELRVLEHALEERRDLRDVRAPGIGGTCPRCFAIHGSGDHFCASCGAALGGAVQGPAYAPGPPPPA